jgi:hypothetical protein
LGEQDPQENLGVLFPWSENDPAENRGVWLMSDPIWLVSSWGKVVQVLLMDTKGTGTDDITISREIELFTEICHQLSSCTLFNVTNEISKKDLDILIAKTSIEPASTHTELKEIPHLIYCVRDWDPSNWRRPEACRGFEHLTKVMESQSLSKRTSIRSKWSNSSCFLLPFPGEMTKLESYNGSLAFMDGQFLRSLEEFIPSIFDPDCLAPLARDREEVLLKFFTLSRIFQAQDATIGCKGSLEASDQCISQRMHLLTISNDSQNYAHFKMALELYKAELNKKQHTSEAELLIAHQTIKKDAINYFVDSDLKGSFKCIRGEEKGLEHNIEE